MHSHSTFLSAHSPFYIRTELRTKHLWIKQLRRHPHKPEDSCRRTLPHRSDPPARMQSYYHAQEKHRAGR